MFESEISPDPGQKFFRFENSTLVQLPGPSMQLKFSNAFTKERASIRTRGEHGQDQDWMSCRVLAIFSYRDLI